MTSRLLVSCLLTAAWSIAAATPCAATAISLGTETTSAPVSDNEAFMVLMLHMSDRPNAMPLEGRQALLDGSGLSASEIAVVIRSANDFLASYNSIMLSMSEVKKSSSGKAASTDNRAKFDPLIAKGWAMVNKVRHDLENTLGSESTKNLWKFINSQIRPSMLSE